MSALGFDIGPYQEIKEIWDKIGRPKNGRDEDRTITYVALCKYRDILSEVTKSEPEYIMGKADTIRNPNYELLDAVQEIVRDLDRELRLSLWPKDH